MSASARTSSTLRHTPIDEAFASAVLDGLSKPQKSLPCRFFYDARGSELFEQITLLPEYYLSRTEASILASHAKQIADSNGDELVLVEFGSGSSRKTEILIDAMPRLTAYVPIDVSADALIDARRRLATTFPRLDVRPVLADFSHPVRLPSDLRARSKLGFFPGSTIGNFDSAEAVALLQVMRMTLAPGGRLVVGADRDKDPELLVRAYDDDAGITAAFNLNILARANEVFGQVFDLEAFEHRAIYDREHRRVEMHLVSRRDQRVRLLGREFQFKAGETIHTESSHKYTPESFARIARAAGWRPGRTWTDPRALFSLHELVLPEPLQQERARR